MLIRKEMCTSGRKCPRKAGRSRVDFERFGRVWRSSSDEKPEESRVVFLEYGGGTIAGTASELNGSQGSGYLAGYSSLGYHEVCIVEVPRQFVLSYGHLLLSLGSLFSLQMWELTALHHHRWWDCDSSLYTPRQNNRAYTENTQQLPFPSHSDHGPQTENLWWRCSGVPKALSVSIVNEQMCMWVNGTATFCEMNCDHPLSTTRIQRRGGGRCATSPQPKIFYSDAFKKPLDRWAKCNEKRGVCAKEIILVVS